MAALNPRALEALTLHQRQLDMDGVEVGVSRQALDELISAYLSSTSAGVTEEQVEAAAKWMARDHAMSGNRSMEAVEEHVAKHWKRYSREAGDILTAAWLTSPASRSPVSQKEAVPVADDLRAEVLRLFKANGMESDERLAILIAECFALRSPAVEGE